MKIYPVIEHLFSLGHKRIGVLGGEITHSNPAKSRYEGCVAAFQKHEIPFDPENQFEAAYFTMEGGYEAMGNLLDKMPDLTAVFAMADVTALGAIRAAKDRGLRVPEDISIVGFDGIEIGQFMVPRLTTIRQPNEQLAARCVELLLQCIHEKTPAINEKVPFYFVEGESTAPLQNNAGSEK